MSDLRYLQTLTAPHAMLKITQIISSIEAEASGPSYTVPRLGQSLAEIGNAVTLLSLGTPNERLERNTAGGTFHDIRIAPDFIWPRGVAKLGLSRRMRRALLRSQANVLHTHGLWMLPNVYPSEAARMLDLPLVLSPRGMLGEDALKFSYSLKRAFWVMFQDTAMRQVACIHATAQEEYRDIRAFGLRQPVAVIPNGIDVPAMPSLRPSCAPPAVVSVGRVHPKKGLDRLIRAWALIEADYPNWRLDIRGPSEGGYAERLRTLCRELGLSRVTVAGPVFGAEKWHFLAQAELFALPTLDENFAMTVAESLASGTPVISTKGAPWAGLAAHRCGWWIDHGPEPMADALKQAMNLSDEERRMMGARGRAWMERDFAWDGIGRQMFEVYRWLIDGGKPPDCVVLD